MRMNFLFGLAFIVLTTPTFLAQITIVDSPFLYKPTDNYNDCDASNICFVDGTVQDKVRNRQIPIRIRFPRNTTGRLPFVLWSHGGGPNENGRILNETWGRTLAKAGYIVVHMSHIGVTSAQERTALCAEFGVTTQQECLSFEVMTVYRPSDCNAVLAALSTLEQTFPALSNRIDRNNIAVAGWSGGSLSAMALAGARFRLSNAFNDVSFANPLPKVFLALSPQGPDYLGFKADSWRGIFRPVLIATGKGDTTPGEDAASRLIPFQSMPPGRKYQLYINHPGSTHDTFNLENENFPQFSQWLASYSLAYFDAYLKNKPAAQAYLISNRLPLQGSRKVAVISRK